MAFSTEEIQNAQGGFDSKKVLLPEGWNDFTIVDLQPWTDKTKGFGIRLSTPAKENPMYLGFSYKYDSNKFKTLIEALGINYEGKINKKDYISKKISANITHEEKTGFDLGENVDPVFNLKDYNDAAGTAFNTVQEAIEGGAKTFTFKQEKIVDLKAFSGSEFDGLEELADSLDDGFDF